MHALTWVCCVHVVWLLLLLLLLLQRIVAQFYAAQLRFFRQLCTAAKVR